MVKFLDGPAKGLTLQLRRAPLYLRVTEADGWDALDQLDDVPLGDETLTAYRRVGTAGTLHVDGRDKKGRRWGAWYALAEYRVAEPQPSDAVMRETAAWRKWCAAQAAHAAAVDPGRTVEGEGTT